MLSEEEQKRFIYYIHKLSADKNFGQDIIDQAVFVELMAYLNGIFISRCSEKKTVSGRRQVLTMDRLTRFCLILINIWRKN